MKITLTELQKNLLERAIKDSQSASAHQEEMLAMIFAYHKVDKPTVSINYDNGELSWAEVPEVVEG